MAGPSLAATPVECGGVTFPTGEHYRLSAGTQEAVVTEVGATLRSYLVAGRDLVSGFAADEVVSGGRGQQLLPWPNRIRDGRYRFAGRLQQLVISEPQRHNASHGLVRHVPWQLVDHGPDQVTQRVRVYPQPGWPGILEATLSHRLSEEGLRVEVTARNLGSTPLPFGYGAHPYLTAGEGQVDELTLTVPAESYLEVDERLLPVAIRPVRGTDRDLRTGRLLGTATLDTAYTDLARGADGRWRVRVQRADRHAELWADGAFGWLQVFTGGPKRGGGVALEPMTCGPDAFNEGPTHAGVVVLGPGQTYAGQWGITGS